MSRAELSECKDCGAAVLDRSRHRAWHRRLDAPARPLRLSDPPPDDDPTDGPGG